MTDQRSSTERRQCTCHPDDNPPRPCPQKYALQDCRMAALESERDEAVRLLRGIDEYLSGHKQNAVYCGSKLHQDIKFVLAKLESGK